MAAIQAVVANLRWNADAKEVAHREEFEALFAAQAECQRELTASIAGMVAGVDEIIGKLEGEDDEL